MLFFIIAFMLVVLAIIISIISTIYDKLFSKYRDLEDAATCKLAELYKAEASSDSPEYLEATAAKQKYKKLKNKFDGTNVFEGYDTAAAALFLIGIVILFSCGIGLLCTHTPLTVRNKLEARTEAYETIVANIELINDGTDFTDEKAQAQILVLKAETNILIEQFNVSLLKDKADNDSIWFNWFVPNKIIEFDTFEKLN